MVREGRWVVRRHGLLTICIAGGFALALPNGARAQFQPAPGSPFPAGAGPTAVAVGDFNGDSFPDLAIADTTGNAITILLGTMTGRFAPAPNAQPISIASPSSIVAADFYGQGKLDLAVASLSDGTVTILQGDGKGNFTVGSVVASGFSFPGPLAVADFNRDGNIDLAIANETSPPNNIAILLGNGNGTFGVPVTASAGNHPVSLAVGNFGGYPGLAVANELDGTVTVLEGNGAANGAAFTLTTVITVPVISPLPVGAAMPYPISVAVADLNGDGLPDLVTANQGTNNISVLLDNPLGTFTPASSSPITVGSQPVSVVAADFNGDGNPDLAVLNYGSGSVMVLLGAGTGGFQTPVSTTLPGAPSPVAMAVGDFNADGKLDLAITDTGANNVTVLLNDSTPSLAMVSAASGTPLAAPGSLVSIYGTKLGTAPISATTPVLPIVLGGTSITITYSDSSQDVLPLFYVSPGQINALMPVTAEPGLATYTVISPSGSQSGTIMVAPAAPALFSANETGTGVAWAQYVTSNFQITDVFQCPSGGPGSCIPVTLSVGSGGSYLVLYGTGLHNAANNATIKVYVMIGAETLPTSYAGPSLFPGEDQINVEIPATLANAGLVPVALMVCSKNPESVQYSNSVTVYLQ